MHTASEATGASRRGGWLPFRVAIVIVVAGLLVVTCGSLIAYVLYRGEYSVALLKRAYLEQGADITVREVLRLPTTTAQVLRVQPHPRVIEISSMPTGRCLMGGHAVPQVDETKVLSVLAKGLMVDSTSLSLLL